MRTQLAVILTPEQLDELVEKRVMLAVEKILPQLTRHIPEVLEAIYEQRKADNKADAGIKTEWDIRKCFEELRFNENHFGLGDIRLTIGMQEEICELVERFYIRR